MNTIQCPNCGGFKTREQEQGRFCALFASFIMVPLFGLFGSVMILVSLLSLYFFNSIPPSLADGSPGSGLLGGSLWSVATCCMGVFFIGIAFAPLFLYLKIKNPNLLQCNICGFKWNLKSPPADKQFRPDLIEKGNQLLEEEDRQRRMMDD